MALRYHHEVSTKRTMSADRGRPAIFYSIHRLSCHVSEVISDCLFVVDCLSQVFAGQVDGAV